MLTLPYLQFNANSLIELKSEKYTNIVGAGVTQHVLIASPNLPKTIEFNCHVAPSSSPSSPVTIKLIFSSSNASQKTKIPHHVPYDFCHYYDNVAKITTAILIISTATASAAASQGRCHHIFFTYLDTSQCNSHILSVET